MTIIASDRDLLHHLGLTDADAANFLYRSRQTIHQALSKTVRGYFKPSDVLALRLAAGQRNPGAEQFIDVAAVADYVGEVFTAEAAEQVRTGYGLICDQFDPSQYRELWVILPSFARVAKQMSYQAERLCNLSLEAPNTKITYFFGAPLDMRAFQARIPKGDSIQMPPSFESHSTIGAQLTMIIGNPGAWDETLQIWVLSATGFQRAVHINEIATVQHLRESLVDIDKKPQEPPYPIPTPMRQG